MPLLLGNKYDFQLNPISNEEKLILLNIHFTPDKDQITTSSEPELTRLTELLKSDKDWEVRIIGHTNNNPFADVRYLQKLSFNRALSVKQYLVKHGVSEKRISCAGMGGKSPIVNSKDVNEGWKNLRVEVVLSKR
jgi:outer membrane protein OmpA-like peptidoglycan-associated protein